MPSCKICLENYNTTELRPVVGICGHTLCSACSEKINGDCPLCRHPYSFWNPRTNYEMIELMEEMERRERNRVNQELPCMVSSPFSLLRPRRARRSKNQTPAPESTTSVTIPPVVVIEEVATASSSDSTPPSDITSDVATMPSTVTEVLVESVPIEPEQPQVANGNAENGQLESPRPVIVDDDEEISQCGCSEALTNGLSKVKNAVEEIPPEYKEAAKYSGLATMSLVGLFVSIVLYRCVKHFLYPEEESFFCSYFSRPFAPMFDALCHQDKPGLVTELSDEAHHLANELQTVIYNFIASIFAGFRAFGTIFWALFGGILQVFSSGLHELIENVSENVAFLFKFCGEFANSLLQIFLKMITGTIDQIGIAFSSLARIF